MSRPAARWRIHATCAELVFVLLPSDLAFLRLHERAFSRLPLGAQYCVLAAK